MSLADTLYLKKHLKRVNHSQGLFFALVLLMIFGITFAFSYSFSSYHFSGDQASYIKAYSEMAGLELIDALHVYPTIIHTTELVHLLVIWIFSSLGVDKNIVMATANALLSLLFAKFLKQKGAGLLMIIWITFGSYYLLAMYFTLERTKFAFIFMLLYFLTERRWWLLLATLTHSMTLIPILLTFAGRVVFANLEITIGSWNRRRLIKLVKIFLGIIAFGTIAYSFLEQTFFQKISYYYNENLTNEIFEGWPIIFLCLLTLLTGAEKRIVAMFFLGKH